MKHTIQVVCITFCLVFISGCMTKSNLDLQSPSVKVSETAKFSAGKATDNSGYQFPPEEEDKFDLAKAMQSSLDAALSQNGLKGKGYTIRVTILNYEPGSAFHRWLLPGFGGTKLTTESYVYSPAGKLVAKIPVHRSINAGGGFTIGAYRYVFDDVAAEIVRIIKTRLRGVNN